nr:immunoglobulin heavy chain junction region [Macaca mulatta]
CAITIGKSLFDYW